VRARHVQHRDRYLASPVLRPMGAGLELYGVRKDGSQFPVEIALSPLETEEGLLVSSAIRDIAERKKAEEKFRGLLESAPDAMVIVNTQGNIVLVNSQTEKLFGYRREELIGQPVELLVPDQVRARHVQHRDRYLASPVLRPMGAGLELYGVRKDGSQFPVEISLSPLQTEEGLLVSSAIRDIAERKKAEDQARQLAHEQLVRARAEAAVEARDRFLSIASHELRTPLNPLQLHVQMLLRFAREGSLAGQPSDRVIGMLEGCERQVKQVTQLVNTLLDISRIAASRLDLRLEDVDLAAVVDDVVGRAAPEVAQAGCAVSVRADGPVVGRWDRLRLDQITTNLLSNALKYGRGKPVEVAVETNATTARLTVRDEGIGIAPADQVRIFERFERAAPGYEYRGLGMGLYIVRQLTEALDGRVHVASDLGQGATFTVELPRAGPGDEKDRGARQSHTPAPPPRS
jgi:PAS domain S-box-containing protein